MKPETKNGISGISAIVLTIVTSLYPINEAKYGEQKRNIISQLRPYVEWVDRQPGISFNDQLDFAKRAGISTNEIIEGEAINLMDLPKSALERALESYQQQ